MCTQMSQPIFGRFLKLNSLVQNLLCGFCIGIIFIHFFNSCGAECVPMSTMWENIDGCAEHYICGSSLYLLSILPQAFNIIIDRGISAPGN